MTAETKVIEYALTDTLRHKVIAYIRKTEIYSKHTEDFDADKWVAMAVDSWFNHGVLSHEASHIMDIAGIEHEQI